MKSSFEHALEKRDDLKKYGANAHLLFALELFLSEEDIHTIAATALTDGRDDKKLDLVYVSRDSGRVIVAQGYYRADGARDSAKANKASDLNTAIAWLLSRPIDALPERIKGAAEDVRSALEENEISAFEIWYVHNLPESPNVRDELTTVEHQATDVLKQNFPDSQVDVVLAREIGRETLDDWYGSLETAIVVSDEFELTVPGGYEINGDDWTSFVTAVDGSWLHELYKTYPTALFAANVRGFMGARKKDQKINHEIQQTAASSPGDFWIYNNGITALVHNFSYNQSKKKLKLTGISIVNGAQTTGSLGSLVSDLAKSIQVPARFIASQSKQKIRNITIFNNSQNLVVAADFRSNDRIQERLREQFETDVPNAFYSGGRRDVHSRDSGATEIPTVTAGQALVAFHQRPWLAYHGRSRIWESNDDYHSVFNDNTSAMHIVFVYSLLKAIEEYKRALVIKEKEGVITESHGKHLSFLRRRGAIYLLVSAIAKSIGHILDSKITNLFRLTFRKGTSPEEAILLWRPIVESLCTFHYTLENALSASVTNRTKVSESIESFSQKLEDLLSFSDDARSRFITFVENVRGG